MRTSTAVQCAAPAPRFFTRLVEMGAGTVCLVIAGDVDLSTEYLFASAVENAPARGASTVIVDLTGVEFFSLSAVAVLGRARVAAAASGVVLDVRVRPGIVSRVLRLVDWPGVAGPSTA